MSNLKSYGIKESYEPTCVTDKYVEEIRIYGYTIVEDLLQNSELDMVRRQIEQVYQVQIKEIDGEENLNMINDANVVRCLLAYDDYFLRLATNSQILSVVEKLLGDYFILLMQNGIVNVPNIENYQVSWHRDLNYQHFVSTRPLAISVLFCIDDFSEETGGTHVLPASHKEELFPSGDFVRRYEKPIAAKAGSALVMDSMLFHRAGYNKSKFVRRAINHVYALPFIKQQISLPKALGGKFKDDTSLRKLLGYESDPGESVAQWRTAKLNKGGAN